MANIIDYVRAAEDAFADRPLNQVDSLVLSWIANMRIVEQVPAAATEAGVTLGDIASFTDRSALVAPIYDPARSEELLRACARGHRFADVVACRAVSDWSREDEKQFAGIAFRLPDGSTYVGFRGTDNTLVGWKENFNMAFKDPVPAQTAALDYLEAIASATDGPLFVGGHSKGGNLAVYAAMMCQAPTRARIARCFSHDGPGFTAGILQDPQWSGAYDLVDRTIPEESIVGLLLDYPGPDAAVVRSDNPGVMQHAPFSWMVGSDGFVTVRAVSYDTYQLSKRLRSWLASMDASERGIFVDALYLMALATGEDTFSGLVACLKNEDLSALTAHLDVLPEEVRTFFLTKLDDLAAELLLGKEPVIATTAAERAAQSVDRLDDLHAHMNDRLSKLDKLLGD